jgi:hypothetical protein
VPFLRIEFENVNEEGIEVFQLRIFDYNT